MMGKVCHASVDDVGDDKVFWEIIRKEKIRNNKEKCPHGAYTCQGPQGSINIRVALVCLNTAPNHEHFMCMHVYAFVRHVKGVCQWH